MNYQTYKPHPDLASLIKCYWTLEVPAGVKGQRQRIVPDGCLEMVFILGDDIKRYVSEDEYIIQPRAMVLGQITKPFFVEPTGFVHSFAARFYPYGFANFVSTPLKDLANKETPLVSLFGEETTKKLSQEITAARNTKTRIKIIETFLFERLNERGSIDDIVRATIDTLFSNKGNISIKAVLKDDIAKRRQLERKFMDQIGMSPKQLGKVLRLQAALQMMLQPQPESLAKIAYNSDYYDQAHFIKDFKEFTGTTPKDFFEHGEMALSSLFYK